MKILIVDDERAIRELLKTIVMHSYQCSIDLGSSPEMATKLFMKKRYDIVFFDYLYLGGQDGLDFLFKLKRREPRCVTVLMSSFLKSMDDIKKEGMGVKPDEFLSKPFTAEHVKSIIKKYFPRERCLDDEVIS